MYTLRVLHPRGDEQNYYLGDLYKVTLKHKSPDNFKLTYDCYVKEHINLEVDVEDGLYGFITSYSQGVQPLYKSNKYYIVMESGKTFQKL
jgi:hypothetical protein